MLSDHKIEHRPDQPFAAIRISLDPREIPEKAPPLIGEVAGWLGSKGVPPAGAPFFNYLEMADGKPMVMEVGFPTGTELAGDGRVRTGVIPAGRYASLNYTGPYGGLYEANVALGEWLGNQGEPQPMPSQRTGEYDHSHLEIYWTDPQEEPDPQRWVTEVAFRLGD